MTAGSRKLRPVGTAWACLLGWGLTVTLSGCALLTLPFDDDEEEAAPRRAPPTVSAQPAAARAQHDSAPVVAVPAAPLAAPATPAAPVPPAAPTATAVAIPVPVPQASPVTGNAPNAADAQRAATPATARPTSAPTPAPATAQVARAEAAAGRSTSGAYALQIGAFRTEAAAAAWRDEIAARLSGQSNLKFTPREASVRVVQRDGLFRVFVGDLDTVAAARDLKSRMRSTVPDSFITRPN